MLDQRRRSTVHYQRWYNVGKQLAEPYSECGKSNFPIVDVQGLSNVYSAPVVDCKIPTFEQRWVYNRPNLISIVEKVIFRQWMYMVYSALVVDCKIRAFVQRWVYNRPSLLPTVGKVQHPLQSWDSNRKNYLKVVSYVLPWGEFQL